MFIKCIFVLAALGAAETAGATDLCPLTHDANNCVRILACVGDAGHWFHGRALGRGSGVLGGQMSDGTLCTGTWTSRNAMGFGQADVTCDDGTSVRVIYTYQEEYTGTAIGDGIFSDGRKVTAYSGLHVLDYFDRETEAPKGSFQCGSTSIPIS